MSGEPIWLGVEEVIWVNISQTTEHGGLSGIRDNGLLKSAVSSPKNLYYYERADIPRLACKYAFGIIMNHPFLDGNKRTGIISSGLFLASNYFSLGAPNDLLFNLTCNLASGNITEEEWEKSLVRYIYKSP